MASRRFMVDLSVCERGGSDLRGSHPKIGKSEANFPRGGWRRGSLWLPNLSVISGLPSVFPLFDDFIRSIANTSEQLVHIRLLIAPVLQWSEFLQSNTANVRQAPNRNFTVAMLSDDICVDAPGINPVILTEKKPESRCVEYRSRPYDLTFG